MSLIDAVIDRGVLPDRALRVGIRQLLRRRLREEDEGTKAGRKTRVAAWAQKLRAGPIAVDTDAANAQHYEVPAAFFERVLGKYLKYSSGYWSDGVRSIDESEAAMLGLTCDRAALKDGQTVLELGCGWGSLSLWMASHYPNSKIVALSNSNSQRHFIMRRARERGLNNLEVRTANITDFDPGQRFDRVVSVEMFEHMLNYAELLRRISSWLLPDGRLFVHIFTHRELAYPFQTEAADDWMGRHFFTGGQMPSDDLLYHFQDHLEIEQHWVVNGEHYAKTSEEWLANLDRNRADVLQIFTEVYGARAASTWIHRWRVFFVACAELFAYDEGRQWQVSHYRMQRRGSAELK